MSTVYDRSVNSFFPMDSKSLDFVDRLPVGVYVIQSHEIRGLFFKRVDDFSLPERLYGDVEDRAERILRTYDDRDGSTGVLMVGEKGSGKTLLAKYVAVRSGLPVVLVNSPMTGDAFNCLIQGIDQPAVILFDEFEKVYEEMSDQDAILTLLDGVFATKKLFLFTCNGLLATNVRMINRPSRVFYVVKYDGLDSEFIREYCDDHLRDTSHVDDVCYIAMMCEKFNFDMLKSLVEEMNRYGESPEAAIRMMNISPDVMLMYDTAYSVSLTKGGRKVPIVYPRGSVFYDSSFITGDEFTITTYSEEKDAPDDDSDLSCRPCKDYIEFSRSDLRSVDPMRHEYTYVNCDGYELVVKKISIRSSIFEKRLGCGDKFAKRDS